MGAQPDSFLAALLAAERCAERRRHRGHYFWRWTPKKESAARLAAKGLSARTIAKAVPVNRRTIARWLVRAEFVQRVEYHRWFGVAGAQARRELREVERTIVSADQEVDSALDGGDEAAIIGAQRIAPMKNNLFAMIFVVGTVACNSDESRAPSAPPPKTDNAADCTRAAGELITKLKQCDLNMDGISARELCKDDAPAANIRAMTSLSCDAIVAQLTQSMK